MRMVRSRIGVFALVIGIAACTGASVVSAQSETPGGAKASEAALEAEIERLKTEVEALRNELRSMQEFLRQRLAQPPPAAPRVVRVAVGDSPTLGSPDAPVTLIEFSDYQCPFCRQFFEATFPALKTEFIDTGKLRYVFRDFPLDQIHPLARTAAEAARCAGDQGKYWAMHDVLFRNQEALQRDRLMAYGQQIQLDAKAFATCIDGGKHQAAVQQSLSEGISAGVRGTPAFVIGKSRPDHTVESVLVTGARPFGDFRRQIERLLAEK